MPTLPRAPRLRGEPVDDGDAVGELRRVVLVARHALGVAVAAHVHPHRGVPVARVPGVALAVARRRPVAEPVGQVLQQRRHRLLGHRPPDPGVQLGAVRRAGCRGPRGRLVGEGGADVHGGTPGRVVSGRGAWCGAARGGGDDGAADDDRDRAVDAEVGRVGDLAVELHVWAWMPLARASDRNHRAMVWLANAAGRELGGGGHAGGLQQDVAEAEQQVRADDPPGGHLLGVAGVPGGRQDHQQERQAAQDHPDRDLVGGVRLARGPSGPRRAATTGASATSKAPSAEAYQLAGKSKPKISVSRWSTASRIIVEYAWKRMKLKTDGGQEQHHVRAQPAALLGGDPRAREHHREVDDRRDHRDDGQHVDEAVHRQPAGQRQRGRDARRPRRTPPTISHTARRMASGGSANSARVLAAGQVAPARRRTG